MSDQKRSTKRALRDLSHKQRGIIAFLIFYAAALGFFASSPAITWWQGIILVIAFLAGAYWRSCERETALDWKRGIRVPKVNPGSLLLSINQGTGEVRAHGNKWAVSGWAVTIDRSGRLALSVDLIPNVKAFITDGVRRG